MGWIDAGVFILGTFVAMGILWFLVFGNKNKDAQAHEGEENAK